MNPFDLTGPQFIALYAGLAVFGVIVAAVLRYNLRTPADPYIEEPVLRPYEVAHLAGGATGAVNAALARMIQGQTLDFDEKSGKLLVRGPLLVGADPLEEAIIRTNDTAFTVKE